VKNKKKATLNNKIEKVKLNLLTNEENSEQKINKLMMKLERGGVRSCASPVGKGEFALLKMEK
jgi:hypothetical protein